MHAMRLKKYRGKEHAFIELFTAKIFPFLCNSRKSCKFAI